MGFRILKKKNIRVPFFHSRSRVQDIGSSLSGPFTVPAYKKTRNTLPEPLEKNPTKKPTGARALCGIRAMGGLWFSGSVRQVYRLRG